MNDRGKQVWKWCIGVAELSASAFLYFRATQMEANGVFVYVLIGTMLLRSALSDLVQAFRLLRTQSQLQPKTTQ